jgi:hypothetical protein
MSGPTGFAIPALAIGLGALYIKPQRGFYPAPDQGQGPLQPLIPQVTIEEVHHDELEITDHPVERGAVIADHAFKRPSEVVIHCAWSNSPAPKATGIVGSAIGAASVLLPGAGLVVSALPTSDAISSLISGNGAKQIKAIYQILLKLQSSAVLFDIYTGKRLYNDMLFKSLSVTTTKDSENALVLTAVCRQVLLSSVKTTQVPINASAQASPEKTTPVQNTGNKQLQVTP